VNPLVRLYWRQAAMVALIALPLVALMILGLVWLLHSAWVYPAFFAMSLAGFAAAILGRSIRREYRKQGSAMLPADSAWAPFENEAWNQIQSIAQRAQQHPPQDIVQIQKLAEEVVQAVSKHRHKETDFAWARFTLPEVLNAVQQACENLRESVRKRVPGSESITIADVMIIHSFYLRHEKKVKAAFLIRRLLRLVAAPQVAVVQELKDYATGMGFSSGLVVAQGWLARLLTEELGRCAINLYAGRYRLTELETKKILIEAAPPVTAPVPIRVLIAGQVNAGKSSLTNALIGAVKSPISALPTPGGVREFRIESNRELDLVVIDTPGLTAIGGNKQTLMEACEKVDLIIWVAQADNLARLVDEEALREIRAWFKSQPQIKPPPMALAITHIDKIRPFKEWSPPYDINSAVSSKAKNIRQAVEQVSKDLGFEDAFSIPLSLQQDQPPYNVDALWAIIAKHLSEAQSTALDRELKQGGGFSLPNAFDQLLRLGRFIIVKSYADHLNGSATRI
jgi:predicted GTPase